MPNPPDDFFKNVENCIFEFIWSGNPDKVKRNTMINPIEEGDMKVTHLKTFSYSLKTSWVKMYDDVTNIGYW